MVLLMPIAAGAPSLDPDALRRLAELGITDLALVRDETQSVSCWRAGPSIRINLGVRRWTLSWTPE